MWTHHKQKILKTKLRSCSDKPADIYDKKVPEVGSNYTFLTVLLLDSVLKKDRNYYPQVLGEWKHTEKEKKVFSILLMTQKILLLSLMENKFV